MGPKKFRSNSPSPARHTRYCSPTAQQNPPVSIANLPLCTSLRIDPYRDNVYASAKKPSRRKSFSPSILRMPVRDDPARSKRKKNPDGVDRTTMTNNGNNTRGRGTAGSSSRQSVSTLRSEMIPSRSMLPARNTQRKYGGFSCNTQEPNRFPLYRTGSYLDPVRTIPSQFKYFISPTTHCVRRLQSSDTSLYKQAPKPILSQSSKQQGSRQQQPEQKKVLYNEGICECPHRPKSPMLITHPSSPMRGGSRNKEINTPFLHKSDSKYHICHRQSSIVNQPRVFMDFLPSTYHQQVVLGFQKQSRGSPRPKRVLQSDHDIDQFLSNAPAIFMAKTKPTTPIRITCPHKF